MCLSIAYPFRGSDLQMVQSGNIEDPSEIRNPSDFYYNILMILQNKRYLQGYKAYSEVG